MKEPQLSGIAKALAQQGRHGDDTLVHVSRKELAMLERMGDGLGVHMTKNPQTGLPEAFNWLGTLGGIAGGAIGTIIMPGAGTAAGAALGSGLGTAAGGGSLKQALIAGAIGGITGYIGGAGVGELANAGESAIAQEALQEGTSELVQQGVQQGVTEGVQGVATDTAAQGVTDTAVQGVTGNATNAYQLQGAGQFGNLSGEQYSDIVSKGLDKGLTTDQINANLTGANAPLMDKISAGWNASSSLTSPFAGQGSTILKTAAGLGGIGMIQPTENSIVNPDTTDSGTQYKGETYMDPATGQIRTRAVPMAAGGIAFGDYDAADAASDGGYSPGGGVNFDDGGIAELYAPSTDDTVVNGINWTQAAKLGPTRRQDGLAAGGGIGNLGGYSDGGRMLKGPGDGVSDSIPASIEGKRPARLADGEFVVPARAVSELGNGSTEAGSKQLYAMLDRIAAKRKSGKGLAYNANPKKLLPA